ncbi:5-(carboxyamino)imidazole ribonucleotide synthase [Mangrovimicrobium sediminis]|uniref:N5-carboxyaminoimidazole ribonucleotide synthase n=2 Tax=Mangrovimicrobium sediminis TaxID=2562682 RepID=A0A4Z0M2Z7_9GAMM|nr:5-(carboxyamino)imidazole ribonucleotide synthase [Haliea sp. SAOS-164]
MHIAIVGCGQLSRMLALAGLPLGFTFSFIAAPREDTRCVTGLGTTATWQPGQPVGHLYQALGQPDCVTVEKEQVDAGLLTQLQHYCPVLPNPEAVATCGHRWRERQLLVRLGIPCAAHRYDTPASQCVASLSLPLVAKSCRDGYDGKNQWRLDTPEDVASFDRQQLYRDCIIEQRIPFERELSQVSVRSRTGRICHYPLTDNHHENGILVQSVAPAVDVPATIASQAQDMISRIMEALDYVGVMAMECFLVSGELLVNELAPRVHNSGHWTQSGSATSQFENHVRAIAGLELGGTDMHGVCGMLNLIGTQRPPVDLLSASTTLHWYGKTVRPARKLGHVNFRARSHPELVQEIGRFQQSCTRVQPA